VEERLTPHVCSMLESHALFEDTLRAVMGVKLAWDNGSACTHSWNERYEGYRYLRYCFWLCCFWMQFGKKFHGGGLGPTTCLMWCRHRGAGCW